jgi:hypothetical protein
MVVHRERVDIDLLASEALKVGNRSEIRPVTITCLTSFSTGTVNATVAAILRDDQRIGNYVTHSLRQRGFHLVWAHGMNVIFTLSTPVFSFSLTKVSTLPRLRN